MSANEKEEEQTYFEAFAEEARNAAIYFQRESNEAEKIVRRLSRIQRTAKKVWQSPTDQEVAELVEAFYTILETRNTANIAIHSLGNNYLG
jgi:hypothetical protein